VLDLALAINEPPWWVSDLGRNVFERDWEVDVVQVEVIDVPVRKLLLDNGLDLFRVMERVPQFADDEEVLTLYEAFLDGARYTLPCFYFIAVVCELS
jgi:hypothetical protein